LTALFAVLKFIVYPIFFEFSRSPISDTALGIMFAPVIGLIIKIGLDDHIKSKAPPVPTQGGDDYRGKSEATG